MAVNKRKILENAQKYLQKGSLDKALKEYRSLVDLDPRDTSARLKLGDIHLRLGDKDEAVAAYLKVAQQFMKDGFDPKAVALFKQIAKLAPDQLDIYVPLAELYQRLGLVAEAMSSLQTATEAFQKAGRKREALELLRKAAALDPTNTTSRLKIADLLRQQGMSDEALNEYEEVAAELERAGEHSALVSVYERVLEIDPGRVAVMISLAQVCLKTGEHARARQLAAQGAEARPDSIEALELHVECLQSVNAPDAETEPVYRALADLHLARGNEVRAREILQRFVTTYEMTDAGAADLGVSAPILPPLTDAEAPDLTQAASQFGVEPPASEPSETAAPEPEVDAPAEPADLEQLLAEASVYLRFGKRDKAIAGLETIVNRVPGHEAALEKLTDALVEDGKSSRAVELLVRGIETACGGGEAGPAGRLLMRLAELDAGAADRLGTVVAAAEAGGHVAEPPSGSAPGPFDDVDLLSPDGPGEAQAEDTDPGASPDAAFGQEPDAMAGESEPGEPPFEVEVNFAETGELEVPVGVSELDASPQEDRDVTSESEISLDAEAAGDIDLSESVAADAEPSAEMGFEPAAGVPSSDDLSASFGSEAEGPATEDGTPEPSVEELSFEGEDAQGSDAFPESREVAPELETPAGVDESPAAEESEAVAPEAAEDLSRARSVPPSPKQILEDLEEADFYYQQGLLEDAESVYRRVLEAAPTNPQALLRLGEIAASRGEDPGEGAQSEEAAATDDFQPSHAGTQADDADDALGDDLAHWEAPSEAVADESVPTSLEAEPELAVESEPAQLDSAPESEPAEIGDERESEAVSFEAESETEAIDEEAGEGEDHDAEEGGSPIARPGDGTRAEGAEISHFDLAAELSDELRMEDTVAALPETPDEAEAQPAASATGGEDSLEAIFNEFKQGVRKTLTAADHETHYDLGIAYREMGLLEDAVGEFRVAMELPQRRLDSLHLMGLCARDLKRYQDAINCFCQALADGEPSDERRAAIDFDLAIALEESGDAEEALRVFESVNALAPEFPGLAERIEALQAMDGLSPAEPEAATDAEEPPTEVFESFDDLIADATAADVTEESEPAGAEASEVQTVEEEPRKAPETLSAAEEVSAEAEDGVDDAEAEAEGVIDDDSVEAADGAEETVADEAVVEAADGADEAVVEAADGAEKTVTEAAAEETHEVSAEAAAEETHEVSAEAAEEADEAVVEAADGAEAAVAEASETLEPAEPATTVEASEASEAPAANEEPEAPEPPDAPPPKPKRGKSSRRRKISFG